MQFDLSTTSLSLNHGGTTFMLPSLSYSLLDLSRKDELFLRVGRALRTLEGPPIYTSALPFVASLVQ
jgi:hypothetical protein